MKRRQLTELGDQAWLPGSIRDALTDYLEFVTNRTHPYAPILPQLGHTLEQAAAREVIDLCSGGAGPWPSLLPALRRSRPLRVLLTDKFPNVRALARAKAASGGVLDFAAEPVDATAVPDQLVGFRTMFAAFHHFPPAQARAILEDAARKGQGVGVFEATHRSVLGVLLTLLTPLLVLVSTPLIRPFRPSRLFWTYVVPVVPAAVLWDGVVSCLRTYTPAELRALTAGLPAAGAYCWEVGERRADRAPLPVTYLLGYPCAEQAPQQR